MKAKYKYVAFYKMPIISYLKWLIVKHLPLPKRILVLENGSRVKCRKSNCLPNNIFSKEAFCIYELKLKNKIKMCSCF